MRSMIIIDFQSNFMFVLFLFLFFGITTITTPERHQNSLLCGGELDRNVWRMSKAVFIYSNAALQCKRHHTAKCLQEPATCSQSSLAVIIESISKVAYIA